MMKITERKGVHVYIETQDGLAYMVAKYFGCLATLTCRREEITEKIDVIVNMVKDYAEWI